MTNSAENRFDQSRSDAFAESLLGTLNSGALALMVSVGHRTRLFDTMAELPPSDSRTIADAAGLDERYVREWLGAMTVGRMVELDSKDRYYLPPEHAAWLCRKSAADNMAVFGQYIAVLGAVEDDIVECFHNGGGVPYEKFTRFHDVMEEDSGQSVLPAIESHILALDDTLTGRLESGVDVLDAGCGRGRALLMLAERFPNSRFVGMDLSSEAIARATDMARERGLTNLVFEQRDLGNFASDAEPDRFDLVFTFDAVHDQARPRELLAGINKTLKPDGIYIMQDIHAHTHHGDNLDNPLAPLLYTVSCMHCMTVSLAQGGEGLGAMWGREQAEQLLGDAGFKRVEVRRLDHDIQNDWYVVRH